MVKAATLQVNQQWLTARRVVRSGSLWDEEEPVWEVKTKQKTVKSDDARSKRIKVEKVEEMLAGVGAAMEKATAKPKAMVDRVVGEREVEGVFGMEIYISEDDDDDDAGEGNEFE